MSKSHSNFDVDKLHDESKQRRAIRERETSMDANKSLSRTYEHDVKATYEASLQLIEDADIPQKEKDLRIAHLESVLSVPGRFDR